MKDRRLTDKAHNQTRTKREMIAFLDEMKEKNGENIIYIESNKRRINLSINEGLLRLIEEKFTNKSELIEKLLVKLLEKEHNKHIKIEKARRY